MTRVYSLGELLIDFTAMNENVSLKEASTFAKNPGGAPANAAVAIARLGGQAAFVGCVGEDPFGDFLVESLIRYEVGVEYVERTTKSPTALAFVARKFGEPDYYFIRQPGADVYLTQEVAQKITFYEGDFLHLGSNSLAAEPIYSTVKMLVDMAKENQCVLSLDVNLRMDFWSEPERARERVMGILQVADVIKCNESELLWLTGESSLDTAMNWLRDHAKGIIVCTLGEKGSMVYARHFDTPLTVPGFPVTPLDATGAGDTYIGAMLYQLQRDGIKSSDLILIDLDTWQQYVRFSSAAAAINVIRTGAMNAMPSLEEVRGLLDQQ